jgi:asparagine synthase (glutamine-hydrolysing)
MCGIAGLYYRDGRAAQPQTIEAMTNAVAHRGPDDYGVWSGGPVTFGHRRLSIRDLTSAGHQPLSDPSGRVTITYNGEIYNDAALRRELSRDFGFVFHSTCDAETIPLAYRAWGEAAFERLEGMFALALWDAELQRLFLVRDGVGIKPLFFSDDGKNVRFASELKGLLADPEQPRRLSPDALHHYFAMGYAGPSGTTVEGVRQVPPGTVLRFDTAGSSARQYWRPSRATVNYRNEAEAIEAFLPLWKQVVDDTMISDVPVGILQSGGIDSTLVTLTAAQHCSVPLFTAGFSERSHDETAMAAAVAKIAGLPHHVAMVDAHADLPATLEAVVHHFDGQVCDESAMPLYLLLRQVRQKVTVALSGDGGDEFFGGYPTYRASQIAAVAGLAVPSCIAAVIGKVAYAAAAKNESRLPLTALISRFSLGLSGGRLHAHARWRRMVPDFQLASLYGAPLQPFASENPFSDYEQLLDESGRSIVDRCMVADQRFHLPAGPLMKADAMSMAHGLEVRVPLLDRRIIEFADQCDASLLAPFRGPTKKFLRSVLRHYNAPAELVGDRKRGFNSPLARMLRTSLRELAERHFSREADRLAPYLQPETVRRFWIEHRDREANHAYTLWPILTFGIWLEQLARSAKS